MPQPIVQPKSWQPWLVWGLAALFFFSHYILRVAPNVLMVKLMAEFQKTATTISLLSAFFLIAYVSVQIPIGMLTDRFGSKRMMFVAVSLFALSTLIFAYSHQIGSALGARIFQGVTSAAAFLCAIKLASAWFPPQRLALVIGLTQAFGLLGGAVGIWPFGNFYDAFGWRFIMLGLFGFYCLLALGIFTFVKNQPGDVTQSKATLRPSKKDFIHVITSPQTWINGFYAGLMFTHMSVLGEFFGVSFLTQVHNIPVSFAKIAVFLMFVSWGIGGPLAGMIADNIGRKKVMIISAAIGLVLVPIIIYAPLPPFLVFITLFIFGLTNTGLVASYTMAGEMHHQQSSGLSVSIANMMSVLVGAAIIPIVGKLLDLQLAQMVNGQPLYTALMYHKALFI